MVVSAISCEGFVQEETCIAITDNPRIMNFFFRIALAFEPLAPTAISYFVSRTLRDWEQQGIITDFKAHTKRLGKFHYKVEIEADLNGKQTRYIFTHEIAPRLSSLGR